MSVCVQGESNFGCVRLSLPHVQRLLHRHTIYKWQPIKYQKPNEWEMLLFGRSDEVSEKDESRTETRKKNANEYEPRAQWQIIIFASKFCGVTGDAHIRIYAFDRMAPARESGSTTHFIIISIHSLELTRERAMHAIWVRSCRATHSCDCNKWFAGVSNVLENIFIYWEYK